MFRNLVFATTLAILTCTDAGAAAPEAAKASLRGDAYYFSMGQMYDLHAFQHARMLHKFSVAGMTVPQDVLEEHLTAVVSNIAAAEKSFAKLSDASKNNSETAKKLTEIKQANQKILQQCLAIEKENVQRELAAEAMAARAKQLKQAITAAYASSQAAASSANVFTEEWDKPGNGAFSD